MNSYKNGSGNKKGILVLTSVILGVVVTFLIMLILSALMLWLDLNGSLSVPFATISVAAGSLAAAFMLHGNSAVRVI